MTTGRRDNRVRVSPILAGILMTGILLAGPARPAAAAEDRNDLGRLFFTPEHRQLLDRQRDIGIESQRETQDTDPTLVINGVVSRSSGRRTVWINGAPQNDNATPSGVSVVPQRSNPGRVVVQTSEMAKENAAVGDSINRSTGETVNLLGDGQIKAHPAAKK